MGIEGADWQSKYQCVRRSWEHAYRAFRKRSKEKKIKLVMLYQTRIVKLIPEFKKKNNTVE